MPAEQATARPPHGFAVCLLAGSDSAPPPPEFQRGSTSTKRQHEVQTASKPPPAPPQARSTRAVIGGRSTSAASHASIPGWWLAISFTFLGNQWTYDKSWASVHRKAHEGGATNYGTASWQDPAQIPGSTARVKQQSATRWRRVDDLNASPDPQRPPKKHVDLTLGRWPAILKPSGNGREACSG